jgi:hypothetical protein
MTSNQDKVKGSFRISTSIGGDAKGKNATFITIESGFEYYSPESNEASRDATRKTGWEETERDIQKQLIEAINNLKDQVGG